MFIEIRASVTKRMLNISALCPLSPRLKIHGNGIIYLSVYCEIPLIKGSENNSVVFVRTVPYPNGPIQRSATADVVFHNK